jgi:ankyrin repeat protein
VYAGDTALHIAAAAHQVALVRKLIAHGADVRARNRRGAEPLHYAANGGPHLDDAKQEKTIAALIEAGADPNAVDKSKVGPLHRAVRNRCTAAVRALLEGGADARKKNGSGSTPADLAKWTTGKSGSGSPRAHAAQAEIAKLLAAVR